MAVPGRTSAAPGGPIKLLSKTCWHSGLRRYRYQQAEFLGGGDSLVQCDRHEGQHHGK